MYKPGLHLLSEFSVSDPEVLKDSILLKNHLNAVITKHRLTKVGEVYHQFPDSGYTAVVCLTESHISIHTWPEENRATFDVFLSNYLNYNNEIVESIHNGVLHLLGVTSINSTSLNR